MREVIYSDEQLKEKLSYWKKRLRLNDWIIKAMIVRQRDFSSPERLGEISYNIHNKTALIKILDPVDYDDWEKQNMERILVHELLHLHFANIHYHFGKESEFYEVFEEQAIESITHGLINN